MNKRKTNLLLISSIVIMVMSLGIIIGFSLWVVGVKQEIVPTYSFEDLFKKNLVLETTYCGSPVSIDDVENAKININKENFNITYSGTNLTNGYPENAGKYTVTITSKTLKDKDGNYRSVDVTFTVKQATLEYDTDSLAKLSIVDKESTIKDPEDTTKTLITSKTAIANVEITDETTDIKGAVYYNQRVTTATTRLKVKPLSNQVYEKVRVDGTFTINETDTNGNTQKIEVGIKEYSCTFTPNNTNNFETLTDVPVTINVRSTIIYKDFSGNTFGDTSYSNKEGKVNIPSDSPKTTEVGYEFGGWSYDGKPWDSDTIVSSDMTLEPIKSPIKYTITYELDGGTNNENNPTYYTIEDTVTLLSPTKSKYSFSGWTGIGYDEPTQTVIIDKGTTGNLTFTAHWERAIMIPTASSTVFTYNGEDQIYDLEYDTEACTISNNVQKNAGTYIVTLALIDKTKAKWENGTTDDVNYEFKINPFTLSTNNTEIVITGEYTYTGSIIKPQYSISVVVSDSVTETLTTTDFSDITNYSDGTTHIYAGQHTITIQGISNFENTVKKSFSVNKANPIISSNPTFSKTSIYEGESVDFSGGEAKGVDDSILKGNFGYTNVDGTAILEYIGTANISTNEVNFTFTPTGTDELNYNSITFNVSINLIPTAYIIGSTNAYYGTVEKALAAATNGSIVTFVPPTLKNYHDTSNKVLPDSISYTIKQNCEIKAGVSLIIPTDNDTLSTVTNSSTLTTFITSMYTDDHSNGSSSSYGLFATKNSNKYLRVTIHIADGVQLTNNGNLIVSGYLSGGTSKEGVIGQTSHSYSRILLGNNSKIIQNNSSANTYCYGYIQEETKDNLSTFDIKTGNLYIPFIVDDYRGFNFSWAMTDGAIDNERCSPFNQIEFRNIDSIVNISYGAQVYGKINVWIYYSASIITVNEGFIKELNLVGTSSNYSFQLTDSTYSSIMYKYDSTTEIAKIKVYGGLTFNDLQMEFKKSTVSVNLSTTNAFFPISYRMDIELFACEGQETANYVTTKQRLKLLPGASLIVYDNCVLNASELVVYTAFYDGSTGNGESSKKSNSANYPLKSGATLKVLDNAQLNATSIAGTVYCDNENNITYTANTITSKEAWTIKSSGNMSPAWTIDDYLELHEELSIQPVDYFDSKNKLYIGVNIFTKYKSYSPEFKVLANDGTEETIIDTYQKVLFFDSLDNYQLEFIGNVYRANYGSAYYEKDQVVEYNSKNSILGVINSILSISNDNNGVNEFNVQEVNITCTTPTVDGKIPLYVGKTVSLEAEVIDINKAYNKVLTWESLDTDIATVDSNGNVTGVSLGKVIIQASIDGVIGTYELEVIEEGEITNIESIYITDGSGNSSEKVAGTRDFDYNGKYGNNKSIEFTLNINPAGAPYSSVTWTLSASEVGRQWIDDNTQSTNTVSNETTITVHTGSGTGTSDDKATLKCVVTDLEGKQYTATFIINHQADVNICVIEGTLISMADGTQKKVEDLKVGDMVMVYNHLTGKLDASPVIVNVHAEQPAAKHSIINLVFDNGQTTRISFEHGFFDVDLNEYIYINDDNYMSMIGHSFYDINGNLTTLISAYITIEEVRVFSPITYKHLNIFTDNLLSIAGDMRGVFNIFELNDDMTINIDKMNADIEKYGLYEYEDWSEYLTYEQFDAFNVKYFKVSIGKGLVTREEIIRYIKSYL